MRVGSGVVGVGLGSCRRIAHSQQIHEQLCQKPKGRVVGRISSLLGRMPAVETLGFSLGLQNLWRYRGFWCVIRLFPSWF